MITIIVPIYNQEKTLAQKTDLFVDLAKQAQVLFVDGGSTDRSRKVVSEYGLVLHTKKDLCLQMNSGAKTAKGDILFFLPANALISPQVFPKIEDAIQKQGYLGGFLTRRTGKKGFFWRLRDVLSNSRANIKKICFSDHGVFVKKDVFLKQGGFSQLTKKEDVAFFKSLEKLGKTAVLEDIILIA